MSAFEQRRERVPNYDGEALVSANGDGRRERERESGEGDEDVKTEGTAGSNNLS